MICNKCGTQNNEGAKFCIRCGNPLITDQVGINQNNLMQNNELNYQTNSTFANTYDNQENSGLYNNIGNQPINPQPVYNQQTIHKTGDNLNVSSSPLNYLMYIIAILIKPFKSFNEEESKLNNTKTSIILAVIISGIMTIINLIKTIFTTVRVASYSWTDGYSYSWEWYNLKNIEWFEVIVKNFLIYACIIFAIALLFYLGSLIIKKQLSFIKSLSIVSTSTIPIIICTMIISPLVGKIWEPLSIVFMVVGAVYSLIILYELMNNELKLDNDIKIYFNLICFSILFVAGYYLLMNLFANTVTSGLDGLLDLFK